MIYRDPFRSFSNEEWKERKGEAVCDSVRETEFVVEREHVGGEERVCGPMWGVGEKEQIS